MKKTVIIHIFIFFSILLTSCPSPSNNRDFDSPDPENPPIVEKEDLFLPKDSGVLFSTNIFEFGSGNGATYWMEAECAVDTFFDFTIDLKKISGHDLGGFGVFFSQKNTGSGEFSALTVLINISGEFCVGLIEDSCFSYLKDWSDSSFLMRGYSQTNRISLSSGSPGFFLVSFNGSDIMEFEDPSDPVHSGGGYGYLSVVSPLENFPANPVSVDFHTIP